MTCMSSGRIPGYPCVVCARGCVVRKFVWLGWNHGLGLMFRREEDIEIISRSVSGCLVVWLEFQSRYRSSCQRNGKTSRSFFELLEY